MAKVKARTLEDSRRIRDAENVVIWRARMFIRRVEDAYRLDRLREAVVTYEKMIEVR